MKLLLTGNSKLDKDAIYHFTIPAFRSASGFVTCPGAGKCAKGCYARQGRFVHRPVKEAHEKRLQASFQYDFSDALVDEITDRKIRIVRISGGGDFYSLDYFESWVRTAELCPGTQFYAYTKCVSLVKGYQFPLPKNLKLIFSYGGKEDHLIDPAVDAHSKVFPDLKSLKAAGYKDASQSDMVAIRSRKVGLIYHGAKSKEWST